MSVIAFSYSWASLGCPVMGPAIKAIFMGVLVDMLSLEIIRGRRDIKASINLWSPFFGASWSREKAFISKNLSKRVEESQMFVIPCAFCIRFVPAAWLLDAGCGKPIIVVSRLVVICSVVTARSARVPFHGTAVNCLGQTLGKPNTIKLIIIWDVIPNIITTKVR